MQHASRPRGPAAAALLLLVAAAALGSAAAAEGPGHALSHRVIVRYAGPGTGNSSAMSDFHTRVQELKAIPGVLHAEALPRLSMAVVTCATRAAGEELIEGLQEDEAVELAVPDTWVRAFDPPAAGFEGEDGFDSLEDASAFPRGLRSDDVLPKQCSAHPACRMRGLAGDCCPARDGTQLSCCSSRGPDLVSLRTHHATYVTAAQDGSIRAAAGPPQDSGKFGISRHSDGTVSLKSSHGKYVRADNLGRLRADSLEATSAARFNISAGANGTVSLLSQFGWYVSAERGGAVVANRQRVLSWEEFSMQPEAGPEQRLPIDPAFPKLWGMHHYAGYDIDAPEAWKMWTGEVGKGITVAVIDTGIDYRHPDLREQMWVNALEIPDNGIDDDNNGYVDDIHGADFANEDGDPMDDQMHGTHCAGTIAGIGNNGVGVTGVAWRGVRLMALKFLDSSGSGRTSDAIKAIDYAVAHGAQIASNSWGGGGSNSALRVAIEHASAAGLLFIAAAGNEGSDNDLVPSFPANYDIPNVVSIASTTWKGELSSFSCYGAETVAVAAPGSSIYSTVPGNSYAVLSGTSMATPHVSGLAALVWMYRPQLSMHQVKELLIGSVKRLPALEGKVSSGGMINAKNALEAAWAFDPPKPPVHAPQAIHFKDMDLRIGAFSGVVTITAAVDQSDIEYYRVYFVSGAGFQLEALGEPVPATGASTLTLELNGSFVPPGYATALVAVSGRRYGEMPARLNSSTPSVRLLDYGAPEFGARSAWLGGDSDLRQGFVKGSLFVERATSEATLTNYNAYWRGWDGARGPLVGSLPAVAFQEPTCSGTSCAQIEANRTADGAYHFERTDYGNEESAVISASGPGRVVVTSFDTEHYYDYISIGSTRLSGGLAGMLPFTVELPTGLSTISWSSDTSINGAGWSFDVYQEAGTGKVEIGPTEVLGSGIEVVAAYGKTELPTGTFAAVVDYTEDMRPSPAAAPLAVHFADTDPAPAIVAGMVQVEPSPQAVAAGVRFYVVQFADAQGQPLGAAWTRAANGADAVTFSIKATPLPEGATQLVARAGGAHGLGEGLASAEVVDLVPRPSVGANTSEEVNVAQETVPDETPRRLHSLAHAQNASVAPAAWRPMGKQAAAGAKAQAQWLPNTAARGSRLVWAAKAEPSSAAASQHSGLRSMVTIRDLDAQAAASPGARAALERALAEAVRAGGAAEVRVTRVLALENSAATTGATSGGRGVIIEVVFGLSAAGSTASLDRVEAQLIVLSTGGAAAGRFDAGLTKEISAAGIAAPRQGLWHAVIGPPQQLSTKMLAAAARLAGRETPRPRRLRGEPLDDSGIQFAI